MICPHCNYEHGSHWKDDKFVTVNGVHGDFFILPVQLTKAVFSTLQAVNLYACPECMKTFVQK